jgi:hypothetical protein
MVSGIRYVFHGTEAASVAFTLWLSGEFFFADCPQPLYDDSRIVLDEVAGG